MEAILLTVVCVLSFATGWILAMHVRTLDARHTVHASRPDFVAEPGDRIEGAYAILERARASGDVRAYLAARDRTPLIVARYEAWRNKHARLRRRTR